jgi:hypothetical protein
MLEGPEAQRNILKQIVWAQQVSVEMEVVIRQLIRPERFTTSFDRHVIRPRPIIAQGIGAWQPQTFSGFRVADGTDNRDAIKLKELAATANNIH